jgi:hypothetical protein
MKFQYDCEKLLGCDQDGIAILEPSHKEFIKPVNYLTICEIIDGIGGFSSVVNNYLIKSKEDLNQLSHLINSSIMKITKAISYFLK